MSMTFDFGKCAQCAENNPKSLQFCRACGTALPWAKNPVKTQNAGPASAANPIRPGPQKVGLGDVAWGAMAVQIFGGIVCVVGAFLWLGNVFRFFPTFPFAGYITFLVGGAIWRAGASM